MQSKMNRKGLWLLLTLAVLIVAVAVIVTVATAADPEPEEEIQDFGYQTLSSLNLAGDSETDLRFLFTIARTDYDEVGFVFSKTNATPTTSDYKKPIDTVYRSVIADGNTLEADEGRHWVVVKMTKIPHEYFDGALYVRGYVVDGGVTRYTEAKSLTVCSAKRHTHEIDESKGDMIGGTAALNRVGTKIGHCDGCNLDNVTEYDATTSVFSYKWTGGGSAHSYDYWLNVYDEILDGGTKHFYPDESNGGLGNDLLVEYSVLWNETLINLSSDKNNGAFIDTRLANSSAGQNKGFCYWSLTDDVKQSDCAFAGSFEYSGLPNRAEDGKSYTSKWMTKEGGSVGSAYYDCPNIGGTDRNNPEWGWHRIQIRFHEEVLNLAAMESDGNGTTEPVYYLTSTTYVDGVPISKLCGSDFVTDDANHYDRKLYKVTSTVEGVEYSDVLDVDGGIDDHDLRLYVFRVNSVDAPYQDAVFAAGDCFATCGHDFVQNVAKVKEPKARTETVQGVTINAPFYYTTYGEHVHTWDGDFVDVQGATLLDHGWSAEHCSLCSAMNEETAIAKAVAYVPKIETWTEDDSGVYEIKANIKGEIMDDGAYFYPDNNNPYGNDLLIEYSILWNPTLLNLDGAEGSSITSFMGSNDLIFWSPTTNVSGSWDHDFPGGFEAGFATNRSTAGLGYTPEWMVVNPNNTNHTFVYTDYPNIGGSIAPNVNDLTNGHEWGWHRIQVRVHEDVTNAEALKGAAKDTAGTYRVTVTTYIDGEPISELYGVPGTLLYTAKADGKGGITYSKISSDKYAGILRLGSTKAQSDKTVYFAIADYYATCGMEFVQPVRKVENPANATIRLGNTDYSAKMYYQSGTVVKEFNTSSNGFYGVETNLFKDVLKGDHFYPAPVNNYTGNDLLIEYSILWNPTLHNLKSTNNSSIQTRFCSFNATGDNSAVFWSPVSGMSGADCRFAGGFEYGGLRTSEAGNPYPKMTLPVGDQYADFPNIGGTNQANPEYGWHRVSVRLRQVVTNEDELRAYNGVGAAPDAIYKLTCWIYIDGELVSILSDTDTTNWLDNNLLFTAISDGKGGIVYTDCGTDHWLFILYVNKTQTSSGNTYFVYKDCSATCGKNFVQDVERTDNPAARVETLPDGTEMVGDCYYYVKGSHTHVWGEYNDVHGATLLDTTHKVQRSFCSICGASQDQTISASLSHSVKIWDSSKSEKHTIGAHTLEEFREGKKFSTVGNDLLIEYSILWNESLTDLKSGSTKPFIDTRFASNADGERSKNLTYWTPTANNDQSDCKYAGSFEWGGIKNNVADNPYPNFNSGTNNKTYYPNIGGPNDGDGTTQTNDRWGWHRVSIRYREEVTNVASLKAYNGVGAEPDASYYLQMWVYIDGKLVIHAYVDDLISDKDDDRKLFSAAANGSGGITYTPNDSQYLIPFYLNSKKAADGKTVYFEVADLYVTVGTQFVQKIKPVASTPDYVDYEIASGVHVNGALWYELAD